MKDSKAGFGVLVAALAAAGMTSSATAQTSSRGERDLPPAVYYFPDAQPGLAPARQTPATRQPSAVPQSGFTATTAPGQAAGSSGDPAATEQQPISLDYNALCASPDGSGKARSEAWVKHCVAAATDNPNSPANRARAEIQQQQDAAKAAAQAADGQR